MVITRRQVHPWHADAVTPGGATSMEVLLRWLTTPGNLARWHGYIPKVVMCREVVALMREEGIMHRRPSDVCAKIRCKLEQFAAADNWIDANGQQTESKRGFESVKKEVLDLCPEYYELAPAMKVVRETEAVEEKRANSSRDEDRRGGEEPSEILVPDDSSTEDKVGERPCSSGVVCTRSLCSACAKRRGFMDDARSKKKARPSRQLEQFNTNQTNAKKVADDSKTHSVASKLGSQSKSKQRTKTEAPLARQVLVEWLTTDGNVKRWRENKTKRAVYQEILVQMAAHGILGRKEDFVRSKLRVLEKQYMAAKTWLVENGLRETFAHGGDTSKEYAKANKICPDYRRLAAVLGVPTTKKVMKKKHSLGGGKKGARKEPSEAAVHGSGSREGEEPKDDEDEDSDDEIEVEEKEDQPERPSPPISLRSVGRKKRVSAAMNAENAQALAPVESGGVETQTSAAKQARGSHADPASPDADQECWDAFSEEERAQRRDLFELKRTMLQKELETKQARLDVQLVSDKMAARQKLLGDGVPQADVDRALPLTLPV